MGLVNTVAELERQAEVIVGRVSGAPNWVLRLFVNNITPTINSVPADFVQASFTGYVPRTLTPATWQPPALMGDRAQVEYGSVPLEWTLTAGPQVVYGYYVTNTLDGTLRWAERFDTPRSLNVNDRLELDVVYYARNDPSPP